MEITIQRKAEKLTLNRKEREGLKSRDIYQKYPKAKAEQLMRSLKERNLWYWDPDFDQDEEDWLGSRLGLVQFLTELFGFLLSGLFRGSPIRKNKGLFDTTTYPILMFTHCMGRFLFHARFFQKKRNVSSSESTYPILISCMGKPHENSSLAMRQVPTKLKSDYLKPFRAN